MIDTLMTIGKLLTMWITLPALNILILTLIGSIAKGYKR